MNVYTLFLFNLISASILLMTSSTPISDVNETIARKIDLATDDRAKDAPIQKVSKNLISIFALPAFAVDDILALLALLFSLKFHVEQTSRFSTF